MLFSFCLAGTTYLRLHSVSAAFQDFFRNWSESIDYSCNLHTVSRVAYSLFPFSLLARSDIDIIMQKYFQNKKPVFCIHSASSISGSFKSTAWEKSFKKTTLQKNSSNWKLLLTHKNSVKFQKLSPFALFHSHWTWQGMTENRIFSDAVKVLM